jgi:hypothetical protein
LDGLLNTTTNEFGDFPKLLDSYLLSPITSSIYVVFVREHNRKARLIKLENSSLSDEQIFQRSKKWLIAIIQRITYEQYLPALLGQPLPKYMGYDASVNPNTDIFFAKVGYKFGYSSLNPVITRLDEDFDQIPDVNNST